MSRVVAGLAVLLAFSAGCSTPEPQAAPLPDAPTVEATPSKPTPSTVPTKRAVATVEVTDVVDGDTIKAGGKTVRLIGIDAPEDGDCYGDEATEHLAELIDGERVRLEADPSQDAKDRYGRTLAFVFLDERNVGHLMLTGGFVREYTYDEPYRYQRLYQGAELAARNQKAGLWSACEKPPQPAPADPAPVYFANCDAARAAGAAPLHEGDPGYRSKLDRDKDGVACE